MLCCVIHGYIIINLDDMSWYVPTTLYYEQLGAIHFALYLKTQHGKKQTRLAHIYHYQRNKHTCVSTCVCVCGQCAIFNKQHTHTHTNVLLKNTDPISRDTYKPSIHTHPHTENNDRIMSLLLPFLFLPPPSFSPYTEEEGYIENRHLSQQMNWRERGRMKF